MDHDYSTCGIVNMQERCPTGTRRLEGKEPVSRASVASGFHANQRFFSVWPLDKHPAQLNVHPVNHDDFQRSRTSTDMLGWFIFLAWECLDTRSAAQHLSAI